VGALQRQRVVIISTMEQLVQGHVYILGTLIYSVIILCYAVFVVCSILIKWQWLSTSESLITPIEQIGLKYLPTYIGCKRTMLGKAYGTKWGAMGICWGAHWEIWEQVRNPLRLCREQMRNLMGTHWEQQRSKNPKEKNTMSNGYILQFLIGWA